MTQLSNLESIATSQPHANAASAAPSPRLRQAAVEFEASFLQELLKPMQHDPLFSGSDGDGDGSMGTIGSMGMDAMSRALASAGGLGIAKHILAQMAPVEAANAVKSATTSAPKGTQCGGCTAPLTMTPPAIRAAPSGSSAAATPSLHRLLSPLVRP